MSINTNGNIPVQLCEEDRHRLDAIIVHLTLIGNYLKDSGTPFQVPEGFEPQEPAGEQNEKAEAVPAEPEKAPWAEAEPAPVVKLADIQKKVVDLSTAGKKDAVKAVIQAYAPKVSAIPEDKLPEVMAKLTELEG